MTRRSSRRRYRQRARRYPRCRSELINRTTSTAALVRQDGDVTVNLRLITDVGTIAAMMTPEPNWLPAAEGPVTPRRSHRASSSPNADDRRVIDGSRMITSGQANLENSRPPDQPPGDGDVVSRAREQARCSSSTTWFMAGGGRAEGGQPPPLLHATATHSYGTPPASYARVSPDLPGRRRPSGAARAFMHEVPGSGNDARAPPQELHLTSR